MQLDHADKQLDNHAEGKQRKAQLEAGYHDSGYRTGWQVLCNSAAAFVACVIWSAKFTPDALPWSLFAQVRGPDVYRSDEWCPVSPTIAGGLSRALVFATLGRVSGILCVMLTYNVHPLASSRVASGTHLARNWAFFRAPHLSLSRLSRRYLQGRTARSLSGERSRLELAEALLDSHNSRAWSWKTAFAEPSGRRCSPR